MKDRAAMAEEQEVPLDRLEDELQERASADRPQRNRSISLLAASTAVFAVLAAIASLASGSYANEALFKANEAVLLQNRTSDTWAEYQADGIKRITYANEALTLQRLGAPDQQVQEATANAKREGDKQPRLSQTARDLETEAALRQRESISQLQHHHRSAFSVTLFQVAIGLAALAALVNIHPSWWLRLLGRLGGDGRLTQAFGDLGPLWALSMITGVLGVALMVYGFLPIRDAMHKTQSPQGAARAPVHRITVTELQPAGTGAEWQSPPTTATVKRRVAGGVH